MIASAFLAAVRAGSAVLGVPLLAVPRCRGSSPTEIPAPNSTLSFLCKSSLHRIGIVRGNVRQILTADR